MFQRLLPYLRLLRFSNTPTALADIVAGFMLVHGTLMPWPEFLCLAVASCCFYSWGMVLNDLYDFPIDSAAGTPRPLVQGSVTVGHARVLCWSLWLVAIGFSLASCRLHDASDPIVRFLPLIVAAVLSLCIWLYDGPLKRTALAPFVMGGCRGLNLLLGASVVGGAAEINFSMWPLDLWVCSGAIACYVAGITWFARTEEQGGQMWQLTLGLSLMLLGIAIIAFGLPALSERPAMRLQQMRSGSFYGWWALAIGLMCFGVIRKAVVALQKRTPIKVKQAVIAALESLLYFNAAFCLYANPSSWPVAVGVLLLVIPITLLRRVIPAT